MQGHFDFYDVFYSPSIMTSSFIVSSAPNQNSSFVSKTKKQCRKKLMMSIANCESLYEFYFKRDWRGEAVDFINHNHTFVNKTFLFER